jgi:hypothetical protein
MSFLPGMRGLLRGAAPGGGPPLLDGSESDGTNLITTGGAGMTADWTPLNTTLTNATTTAPDGTTTASSLIENSADNRHILYRQPYSGSFNINRTFSIYAKDGTRRYLQLMVAGSTGIFPKAVVYADLQTGVITDSEALYGATVVSAAIHAAVNGFWKVEMVFNLNSSSDNPYVLPALSNVPTYGAPLVADSPSYAGDGTSRLYLWRPKLV